jgi:hypothetical protein
VRAMFPRPMMLMVLIMYLLSLGWGRVGSRNCASGATSPAEVAHLDTGTVLRQELSRREAPTSNQTAARQACSAPCCAGPSAAGLSRLDAAEARRRCEHENRRRGERLLGASQLGSGTGLDVPSLEKASPAYTAMWRTSTGSGNVPQGRGTVRGKCRLGW